jgi:hypothetical protein
VSRLIVRVAELPDGDEQHQHFVAELAEPARPCILGRRRASLWALFMNLHVREWRSVHTVFRRRTSRNRPTACHPALPLTVNSVQVQATESSSHMDWLSSGNGLS